MCTRAATVDGLVAVHQELLVQADGHVGGEHDPEGHLLDGGVAAWRSVPGMGFMGSRSEESVTTYSGTKDSKDSVPVEVGNDGGGVGDRGVEQGECRGSGGGEQ
jgi:hypothetical protein